MPLVARSLTTAGVLVAVAMSAAISAAPAAPPEEYVIRDAGMVRRFVIAPDELSIVEGKGSQRIEKVASVTVTELLETARARSAKEPVALILYEKGREHDPASRRWLHGRVLAVLRAGADPARVAAQSGASGWETRPYFPEGVILSFTGDPAAALTATEALRRMPQVRSADPLLARHFIKRLILNDPFLSYTAGSTAYQWYLRNTGQLGGVSGIDANVTPVWDTWQGDGVRIGIVDDGVEVMHPDLAPNADTENDYDWQAGDDDPSPDPVDNEHGTACAGLALARGNNGRGGAGAAPRATMVGMRLNGDWPIDDSIIADAMAWKNDIIQLKSNSWGVPDDGIAVEGPGVLNVAALVDATTNGRDGKGTVFLFAAGNGREDEDDSNTDGWANSIRVIAVGAAGDQGLQADYAEYGANILVCGPSSGNGQEIATTDITGAPGYNAGGAGNFVDAAYTNDFGGTSAATPVVAGCTALLLQSNPNLGWRDVKEILIRSARRIDSSGFGWFNNAADFHFHDGYGAGLIDAQAAVQLGGGWTILPPMQSKSYPVPGIEDEPIPDVNPSGVVRTVAVPVEDRMRVEQVEVEVDIRHPYRGDLNVSVRSPLGTISRLLRTRGYDDSDDLIWTMSTPQFWGERSDGQWLVRVADQAAEDLGTWLSAKLTLHGAAEPAAPPVITSPLAATGAVALPFSYQIKASGSPQSFGLIGAPAWMRINPLTGVVSGTPNSGGTIDFIINASNVRGGDSKTLTINLATDGIATTLNGAGLTWQRGGSSQWMPVNTPSHDGLASMQAGSINDNQESWIQTTVTGPDRVSWWWRTSSEPLSDALTFLMDNVAQTTPAPLSGESDWQYVSFNVPAGQHALRWRFQKDVSLSSGQDTAWLDEVHADGLQPEPRVTSPLVATAAEGAFYTYQITSSRNPATMNAAGLPPGLTVDAAGLISGLPEAAGSYPVLLSVVSASGASSSLLTLSVVPAPVTLAEGADAPGTAWAHSIPSGAYWFTQNGNTHDGIDALQSGAITGGQQSRFQISVTGPGLLSFWWRVSSQPTQDRVDLLLDEAFRATQSGERAWLNQTLNVPAGNHVITWRYIKNASIDSGQDAAWVDEISFAPADTDTDGLPDAWEQLHFTNLTRAATDDDDGDGQDNATEFFAGTLPRDARSFFAVTAIRHAPQGSIVIDWPAPAGRLFEVQVTTDLLTWANVPGTISAGNGGGRAILTKPGLPDPAADAWWRVIAR